jgi:hypothetical protein
MTIPDHIDDLDLELPALDGEDDGFDPDDADAITMLEEGASDLDDSTAEDAPHEDISDGGAEGGWLLDSEDATALDVGAFDVAIGAEVRILEDDEPEPRAMLDDPLADQEAFVSDAGEEGPLGEDEELREEDLPALDADDDGDVPDEALFDDRSLLTADDDLHWDDRAWGRADMADIGTSEHEDSGLLAVPSEDPTNARDATWRTLEETGRVMAASNVPGGSVVLAVASADRSRALLVRIKPDGEARIIAEVDPRHEDAACVVTFVRWDASGALVVGGTFGVEAYRPA